MVFCLTNIKREVEIECRISVSEGHVIVSDNKIMSQGTLDDDEVPEGGSIPTSASTADESLAGEAEADDIIPTDCITTDVLSVDLVTAVDVHGAPTSEFGTLSNSTNNVAHSSKYYGASPAPDGAPPPEFDGVLPINADNADYYFPTNGDNLASPGFDVVIPTVIDAEVVYLPTNGDTLASEKAVLSDNAVINVVLIIPSPRQDGSIARAPSTATTADLVSEGATFPRSSSTFGIDGAFTASEGDLVSTDIRRGDISLLCDDDRCVSVDTSISITPVEPSSNTTADAVSEGATFRSFSPSSTSHLVLGTGGNSAPEGEIRTLFGRPSSTPSCGTLSTMTSTSKLSNTTMPNNHRSLLSRPSLTSDCWSITTTTIVSEGEHGALFGSSSASNCCNSTTTTWIDDVAAMTSTRTTITMTTIAHRELFDDTWNDAISAENSTKPPIGAVTTGINHRELLSHPSSTPGCGSVLFGCRPSTSSDTTTINLHAPSTTECGTGISTTVQERKHRASFGHPLSALDVISMINHRTAFDRPSATSVYGIAWIDDISAEDFSKLPVATTTFNYHESFGRSSSTPGGETVLISNILTRNSAQPPNPLTSINHRGLFGHPSSIHGSVLLGCPPPNSESTFGTGGTTTDLDGNILSTVVLFYDNCAQLCNDSPISPTITTRIDNILTAKYTEAPIASTMINDDYYFSTTKVRTFMVAIDNNTLHIPLLCPSSWKTDDVCIRWYMINDSLGKTPQLPTKLSDQYGTIAEDCVVIQGTTTFEMVQDPAVCLSNADNRIIILSDSTLGTVQDSDVFLSNDDSRMLVCNTNVADSATEGVIMHLATVHPAPEGACQSSFFGTNTVYSDGDSLLHCNYKQKPINTPSDESIVVSFNDEGHDCSSMQFHVRTLVCTGQYLKDDVPDSSSRKHCHNTKYHWILEHSTCLSYAHNIADIVSAESNSGVVFKCAKADAGMVPFPSSTFERECSSLLSVPRGCSEEIETRGGSSWREVVRT